MAELKTAKAGSLREGGYIMFDNQPCIVQSVQLSKTSGRGVARIRLEAVGLMDSKKRVELFSPDDNVHVPLIEKKSASVLSIQGDIANLMDTDSYETFDIKIPEELKGKISEGGNVSYWVVLDQRILRQAK